MEFLAPLAGLAGNVLGGIFGSSAADKAQKQAELNRQMQLQFAQNAIQWKVKDAEAAGVHPLYALGAQTSSYSPVQVGSTDNTVGEAFAAGGQNLSRAFAAAATADERALQLKGAQLDIEGKGLANDIARAELASKVQRLAAGVGPAMPGTARATGEKITNTTLLGGKVEANPIMSDAQTFENRYGEGSDYVIGPVNAVVDEFHSKGRQLSATASVIRDLENIIRNRYLRLQERFGGR